MQYDPKGLLQWLKYRYTFANMTESRISVSIIEDTEDIREALRVLINGSTVLRDIS